MSVGSRKVKVLPWTVNRGEEVTDPIMASKLNKKTLDRINFRYTRSQVAQIIDCELVHATKTLNLDAFMKSYKKAQSLRLVEQLVTDPQELVLKLLAGLEANLQKE